MWSVEPVKGEFQIDCCSGVQLSLAVAGFNIGHTFRSVHEHVSSFRDRHIQF